MYNLPIKLVAQPIASSKYNWLIWGVTILTHVELVHWIFRNSCNNRRIIALPPGYHLFLELYWYVRIHIVISTRAHAQYTIILVRNSIMVLVQYTSTAEYFEVCLSLYLIPSPDYCYAFQGHLHRYVYLKLLLPYWIRKSYYHYATVFCTKAPADTILLKNHEVVDRRMIVQTLENRKINTRSTLIIVCCLAKLRLCSKRTSLLNKDLPSL